MVVGHGSVLGRVRPVRGGIAADGPVRNDRQLTPATTCCAPTQGDYIQTTDKELLHAISSQAITKRELRRDALRLAQVDLQPILRSRRMRTPANSFDRADKALCRAHGDAVHEHYPMPPFTTAEVRHFKEAFSYRASVNAFEQGVHMPTDAPLPPTYDQDLDEWLRECEYFAQLRLIKPSTRKWLHGEFDMHSLGAADNAAHGDAYVSAKQPDQSEVWHSEPPAVAGVYIASMKKLADTRRYWNGSQWSQPWYGQTPRHECKSQTTDVVGIQWLRLIEADKPAETAAPAAAEYSVCIKAHGMAECLVGDVQPGSPDKFAHPGNWLPCDKDGWVSHEPRADSVCPVPDGLAYEARFRDGDVMGADATDADNWRRLHVDSPDHAYDIVAWRPTGATA